MLISGESGARKEAKFHHPNDITVHWQKGRLIEFAHYLYIGVILHSGQDPHWPLVVGTVANRLIVQVGVAPYRTPLIVYWRVWSLYPDRG